MRRIIAPEALDSLAPEERQHLYKILRLKALQRPDGKVELEVSGVDDPCFMPGKTPAQVLTQPHEPPFFTHAHGAVLTRTGWSHPRPAGQWWFPRCGL
jgi:hypothetical protein